MIIGFEYSSPARADAMGGRNSLTLETIGHNDLSLYININIQDKKIVYRF